MVGMGVDFDDVEAYVRANDVGTAVLLRALAGAALRRPPRAGQQHGRLRGGPLPLSRARRRWPRRRARASVSQAGRFEPPCPRCGRDLEPEALTEDAPDAGHERLRRDQAPPGAPVRASTAARPGCPSRPCATTTSTGRGCRATPRTPAWPPSSAARWSAAQRPQVFEDGRQLRDFVHVDDVVDGQRARADRARAGGRSVQRGQRPAALGGRDGRRPWRRRSVPHAPRPQVTGGFRLADFRHCFASPQRAAEVLGFRSSVPFERGMAEFARAPLRVAARDA